MFKHPVLCELPVLIWGGTDTAPQYHLLSLSTQTKLLMFDLFALSQREGLSRDTCIIMYDCKLMLNSSTVYYKCVYKALTWFPPSPWHWYRPSLPPALPPRVSIHILLVCFNWPSANTSVSGTLYQWHHLIHCTTLTDVCTPQTSHSIFMWIWAY